MNALHSDDLIVFFVGGFSQWVFEDLAKGCLVHGCDVGILDALVSSHLILQFTLIAWVNVLITWHAGLAYDVVGGNLFNLISLVR